MARSNNFSKFFIKMRYLKVLLVTIITFAILVFLFYKIDFQNIQNTFQASNKYLLGLASFILLLASPITAYRWKTVLSLLGHEVPFSKAAFVYFANYPISKIGPAGSGDTIRAFFLKDLLPASKQLGGILAERLFDIATLSILSLLGALITRLNYIALISAAIILGIIIFFVAAQKIRIRPDNKWKLILDNFFLFFKSLSDRPFYFFKIAGLTLFPWLIVLIHIKLSFLAFGVDVPFFSIVSLQPMVVFISLIPVTLAGIGAREPAQIVLFSGLASAPAALAVGLTYSVIVQIMISLICLPLFFIAWKKISQNSSFVNKQN